MNNSSAFLNDQWMDVNGSDIFTEWNGTGLSESEPLHNTSLLMLLNDARRSVHIPIIIFLVILMIAGILGNGLVMIIYQFYSPKTSANFFILVLAITDLLSCMSFIPFSVYDLWNPYINAKPTVCKIMRSFENQAYLFSGFIYICISCERYVKICYPFHTYTISRAKTIAFIVFVLSWTLSWPKFVMYGHRTMIIGPDRVVGEDCTLSDQFQRTIYSLLYNYLLFFVYIVCSVAFFFFYGNILLVIIKRHLMMKTKPNRIKGDNYEDSLGNVVGVRMRSSRTTLCVTTVILTGIATFVPFLTLQTLHSSGSYFKVTLTPSGEFFHYGSTAWIEYFYMFGVRSYFLGSVANPIIYSIINPNFRSRSKIPFKKLKEKLYS